MNTTTRSDYLRTLDSANRTFNAVAWDGPLSALDANELTERAEAVGSSIGASTTRFSVTSGYPDRFAGEFEVSVDVGEIRKWATVRAACLNELERRAAEAGVTTISLVLASPSWEAKRAR